MLWLIVCYNFIIGIFSHPEANTLSKTSEVRWNKYQKTRSQSNNARMVVIYFTMAYWGEHSCNKTHSNSTNVAHQTTVIMLIYITNLEYMKTECVFLFQFDFLFVLCVASHMYRNGEVTKTFNDTGVIRNKRKQTNLMAKKEMINSSIEATQWLG